MKSLCSLPVGPEQIERAVELRRAIAQAGGLAVVERFIGTQRGLTRAERDLVLDWADNSVRGIFELRGRRGSGTARLGPGGAGAVTALNLVDDLDYVVYGLDPRPADGGFFAGTLLPLARDDSAWLAAGGETVYPADDGRQVARLAIDLATREPDLVFRNAGEGRAGLDVHAAGPGGVRRLLRHRRAGAADPGGRGAAQRVLQGAPRLGPGRAGQAPGGERGRARPRS